MEAQEILKMIEAVDPNDTQALDEIDARVHAYFHNKDLYNHGFYKDGNADVYTIRFADEKYDRESWHTKDWNYTRSRDALKGIRPEGWTWVASTRDEGCHFNFYSPNPNHMRILSRPMPSDFLPTEELAELHAIISAIQWERNNEK